MRLRGIVLAATALALLGQAGWALACSCVWAGPFTTVAPGRPVVVLGEVVSHRSHSVAVRVIESVKGAEARGTIRVWGDNGALCRPYVDRLPIGSRWLLAVAPLPEPTSSDPFREGFHSPPGDPQYAISVCGEFWLEVRGAEAIGRITADHHSSPRESVPLDALLAWLRSGGRPPTPTPVTR